MTEHARCNFDGKQIQPGDRAAILAFQKWLALPADEQNDESYNRLLSGKEHDAQCIYCEHGPYCLICPCPDTIPDDAHVCKSCREAITRAEIAADPYYSGNWP